MEGYVVTGHNRVTFAIKRCNLWDLCDPIEAERRARHAQIEQERRRGPDSYTLKVRDARVPSTGPNSRPTLAVGDVGTGGLSVLQGLVQQCEERSWDATQWTLISQPLRWEGTHRPAGASWDVKTLIVRLADQFGGAFPGDDQRLQPLEWIRCEPGVQAARRKVLNANPIKEAANGADGHHARTNSLNRGST